ncbi:hypothetical protein PG993_004701 [Apiospora rasikravindrae]|uniref:Uncharacterized protein n=1 Tax=Apiospora rasikravindrae TaxID=990691 RepID=A0ABR1TE54_9PEZI
MTLSIEDTRNNVSEDKDSTTSEEASDDESSSENDAPYDPDYTIVLEMPDSIIERIDLEPLKNLTEQDYKDGHAPRFGKSNPEIIEVPFWSAMIAAQENPFGAYSILQESDRFPNYNGIDDFWAPETENSTGEEGGEDKEQVARTCSRRLPTWTFASRFGQTMTRLPDGRLVFIGGEYDDSYDPDFHVYNDVCVYDESSTEASGDGGGFTVYCYPRDVFPPTDFHTATLVPDTSDIYVIGCMGYPDQRRPGETPVYRLDTRGFSMHPVETSGEKPGWISQHCACIVEDGTAIRVWGKKRRSFGSQIYVEDDEKRGDIVDFEGEYLLHLETGRWSRQA